MAKLKLWQIIVIVAVIAILLGGLGYFFVHRSDKKAALTMSS